MDHEVVAADEPAREARRALPACGGDLAALLDRQPQIPDAAVASDERATVGGDDRVRGVELEKHLVVVRLAVNRRRDVGDDEPVRLQELDPTLVQSWKKSVFPIPGVKTVLHPR